MRYVCILWAFLMSHTLKAQNWMAEVSAGIALYNGDLTEQAVSIKQIRPTLGLGIRYNANYLFNFRAGISYARLGANDRNNKDPELKLRNLNFQTNLFEFHAAAELNLMDPELFYGYPYLFAGAGLFYFNPYTRDDQGVKRFLQPLGTEGQGLSAYPDRKKYSLLQLCLPVGGGWRLRLKNNMEIMYELGYRVLITDYLDDVSRVYPSMELLAAERGDVAATLSYRKQGVPFMEEGEARGNSKVKDSYFFSSIKLAINIDGFKKIKNYRRH